MDAQSVESFMTKKVFTLSKTDLVAEAINIMAKNTISCIVIVDKKRKPIGIITERDVVKRVLQMGVNPSTTEISYVMSSPVFTISKDSDIFDTMMIMQNKGFRRVVIVEGSKLAGIVTQSDLLKGIKRVQERLIRMNSEMKSELEKLRSFTKGAQK